MNTKHMVGILLISVAITFLTSIRTSFATDHENGSVIVILTVNGHIQTDDPWKTGAIALNQWAKPMYRIWFDTNGNPSDGGWGNGSGPKVAEIWLDSGRLGYRWDGLDNDPNSRDDIKYWPLTGDPVRGWNQEGVRAKIDNDGKSLKVILPIALLGNPRTLEVSFMASPWTSQASDNLGSGAYNRPAWIVVSDTTLPRTYSRQDPSTDNKWPKLEPNRKSNFDIIAAKVIIKSSITQSNITQIETQYEGSKNYVIGSTYWRQDGVVEPNWHLFFPEIDNDNKSIRRMLRSINIPSGPTRNDSEIWKRTRRIWSWLQTNGHSESSPVYNEVCGLLESIIKQKDAWPSVNDLANILYTYNGFCWGLKCTCMCRAQIFATLLYKKGIPTNRFAIAETKFKSEYSQHMYVVLKVGSHWYYLDPVCATKKLSFRPNSIGCTSADYRHPHTLKLLPGSSLKKPMLVQ